MTTPRTAELLEQSDELERSVRRMLDCLVDPPDPGPYRVDRLDFRKIGSIGDRGTPLSSAVGTLLLALHHRPESTVLFGPPAFLASQASFAADALDRVSAQLGDLVPAPFSIALGQLRSASHRVFTLIEEDYSIPRGRWLDG